ncbi:MAG: hypothetical protein AAGB24_16425 [Bacteroidota bacterium]
MTNDTFKRGCHMALILFVCSLKTISQENMDQSDLLVHEPPLSKFKPIVLQKHDGLRRMGIINNYRPTGNGAKRTQKSTSLQRTNENTREKVRQVNSGYVNYSKIVCLKYMSSIYIDIDKEQPTALVSGQEKNEKQKNSYIAQQHLRNLAQTIFVDTEYFQQGYGGSNEFERRRNYATFVKKHLHDLQQWSRTFFEDDTETVYLVSRLALSNYDFDNQGYWVNLSFSIPQGKTAQMKTTLLPRTSYETHILNLMSPKPNQQRPLKVFLPMEPTKAEALLDGNITALFAVKKIVLAFDGTKLMGNRAIVYFNYYHKSPTVTLYQDMALTKQVTALSLERLKIKKQN